MASRRGTRATAQVAATLAPYGRGLCVRELALPATAWTAAVRWDAAELDPPAFDAVTVTSSVRPTSLPPTLYDLEVAPAIALHSPPLRLQRRHWYLKCAGDPVHDPWVAVSLWCTRGLPDIAGRAVRPGAADVDVEAPLGVVEPAGADGDSVDGTVAVAVDMTDADPSLFDAVTVTASALPASALVTS